MNFMPSNKAQSHIDLARRMATHGTYSNFRHGCVLVGNSGKIINCGFNKSRYTSFGARFRRKDHGRATVHAELSVILNLDRHLTHGATVYVVRIGADGNLRNSKPCEMCQAAMEFVGIKKVVYSTGTDFEMIKF